MRSQVLFKQDDHVWYMFGQDPAKPENIIDSNQIVICSGDETVLLDPGGMEIFPSFLAALTEKVNIDSIKHIFLSHQDPDIGSSLSLWRRVCGDDVNIYLPWMWAGFIAHFDAEANVTSVPDEGMVIRLKNGRSLDLVPAHFLHSPGNLNLFDAYSQLLFTGDIGAALLPPGPQGSFHVEKFEQHTQYMEAFHKRWMGSTAARDAWISQVRRLSPGMLVPQHGLCFRRDDVDKFLDWFGALEIGAGVSSMLSDDERKDAPRVVARVATEEPVVEIESQPSKPVNDDGTFVIKDDAPLFAKLGGAPAVDIVVDAFYTRITSDPRLSAFFENADIDALKRMQKSFMGVAFGGPDGYSGRDLRAAHSALVEQGINDSHFDIVAAHLRGVLEDFQVDTEYVTEVMNIVESVRDDILNR